jgi:hypothetical protein
MRIVQDMGENGAGADFFIGKRLIACVFWDADGNSEWEQYFDEKGKLKREVNRHWNGRLMYLCRCKNGFPHGVVRQWDDHGGLLLETRFQNGTGLDLWWSGGLPSCASWSRAIATASSNGGAIQSRFTKRVTFATACGTESHESGETAACAADSPLTISPKGKSPAGNTPQPAGMIQPCLLIAARTTIPAARCCRPQGSQ